MPHPQPGCICVDGRFFEPHEATVSVLDTGFLLGDGLFESLRAWEGVPYLLDRHLARLLSAAAEFEFAEMPDSEALAEQVHGTLGRAALADAYVRVTVTRGTGAAALVSPAEPPTVVIAALPAPARVPADRGIEVTLLRQQSERRAQAKSTSRQQAVLARRRADRVGADEGIYLSESGHVLEGIASNVFVVEHGGLLTPPASKCLPGITRARLLELARGTGLTVSEAPLEVEALMNAEELFVTNAVQGLRFVRTIDGQAIASAEPDGVFATLRGLYEDDRRAVTAMTG